ncbi:MAG: LysR family transcriptional regulator [Bacteroidaceae bacterium]
MLNTKTYTLISFVNTKNFSKTAEELHMTQPNVTYQIKALEKEYGIHIYSKDRRNITITKQGELLAKYAQRLVEQDKQAQLAVKNYDKGTSSIVVGITPTAEETMVPHIFAKYAQLNPDVHIKIVSHNIRHIYSYIKNFSIDLGLIEGQINNSKLESLMLDTDFLVLAVSPKNALAKKRSVTLAELKQQNLILRLTHSGTRQLFESSLLANNETIDNFKVTMEIDNINTIKELVSNDYGATVIANSSCVDEANHGKLILIPIEKMSMVREINLVYRKDFSNLKLLTDIQQIYKNSKYFSKL